MSGPDPHGAAAHAARRSSCSAAASGIGLETARRTRDEGANADPHGPRPGPAAPIGLELGASISAFDLNDTERLTRFFTNLPGPVDHVLVSGAGPHYVPFAELDIDKIRHGVERIVLSVQIARLAKDTVQPGGSLLLIGGTGGRRPSSGPLISAVTAAMPALARSLALELAPVRVNVIAPGFVDTSLSASILGAGLDARREQLRASPAHKASRRPGDVATLALDLMTNTAITGATFDIDGGQQLLDD